MNEKQKKPFVLLSFISRIITLISYCCFVSRSDQGTERGWCEFFCRDTVSTQGGLILFFWGGGVVSLLQKHLFKENMLSQLLKVIV